MLFEVIVMGWLSTADKAEEGGAATFFSPAKLTSVSSRQ